MDRLFYKQQQRCKLFHKYLWGWMTGFRLSYDPIPPSCYSSINILSFCRVQTQVHAAFFFLQKMLSPSVNVLYLFQARLAPEGNAYGF